MHDILEKQINNAWYIRNKKINNACYKTVVSNDTNTFAIIALFSTIMYHKITISMRLHYTIEYIYKV